MIIHKGNLDKWFFDYFEGNLSSHEILELKDYLASNPSAHADFEAWKETYQTSKEKSKRIPLYAGASGLLVETSLLTRINWNVAALLAIVIGSIGTIGYLSFQSPSFSESALSVIDNEELKAHFGTTTNNEGINANQINEITSDDLTHFNLNKQRMVRIDFNSIYFARNNYSNSNVNSTNSNRVVNDFNNSQSSRETHPDIVEYLFVNSESHINDFLSINKAKSKSASTILLNSKGELEVDYNLISEDNLNTVFQKDKYNFLDFTKVATRGFDRKKDKRKVTASDNNALISERSFKGKSDDKVKKVRKNKSIAKELSLYNVHDPIFVKSYQLPMQNNYALAGDLGLPRVKFGVRDQFKNSFSNSITMNVSADWYLERLQAGIGVSAQKTALPNIDGTKESYGITYNQKFEIDRLKSFSLALTYNYNSFSLDSDHLNSTFALNSGQDLNLNLSKQNVIGNDLALSTWYNGERFYGGFSVSNLLLSKNTLANLLTGSNNRSIDYSVQLGTDYKTMAYSNFIVSPQLNYEKHSKTHELWLGSTFKYYWIVAGVSASTQKSAKAIAGIQNSKFRLMYGYDLNNSSPENGLFNSHELSLRILFGTKKANWSR